MSESAALVTYAVTEEQIAETKARYAALSCDTPKGYEEVRLAIAEVRDARVAVEKRRVELKADALAYGRLVDSKAKELTAMLLEIEEPLKAKKQAVDDEKARIRAEAEAAKRAAIEAAIAAKRAEEEEKARLAREAEEKRLAEERAALEAERAKLVEAQAALEAARKAEEDRRETERKAEEAKLAEARKAEEDRLAAIRKAEEERLAAERRAEEERQRTERAAIEAERKAAAAAREAQERAEFERQAKLRAEREAARRREGPRVRRPAPRDRDADRERFRSRRCARRRLGRARLDRGRAGAGRGAEGGMTIQSAADARDHADRSVAPAQRVWEGLRNSAPSGRATGGARFLVPARMRRAASASTDSAQSGETRRAGITRQERDQ